MTDQPVPLLQILGWIIGMVIFGATAVSVGARTGLDIASIGQTYLAVGVLLFITLLVGLSVIAYVWLSQQTNNLGRSRRRRGR